MRLRMLFVAGALAVGVTACEDAIGPQPDAAQDLEFYVPDVPAASRMSGARSWLEPISAKDSAMFIPRGANLVAGGQIPLISRTYVSGGWSGDRVLMMYGMFGGGTGYSMRPRIRLINQEGQYVLNTAGMGRSEDQPIYWYFRPTAEEWFTAPGFCGHRADMDVQFEARVGIPILFTAASKTDDFAQHTAVQESCPPPPSSGSGPPLGSGLTLTICHYEAWVDLNGNVLDIIANGCTSTPLPLGA